LSAGATRLGVVGASDQPAAFAAGPAEPGIAYAELREGGIDWIAEAVADARRDADAVLVTPH
jgi:poly-gamma-glutamate synthesis protein (capsule biosynthesis protein)